MNTYTSQKTGFRLKRGKMARRGQSLVEFALTLPVLLTILAGVVEVGNILVIYNRAQMAAREGARFGAMGGTNPGVLNVVQQSSTSALAATDEQMQVWVIRPKIQIIGTTWSWQTPVTTTSWGSAAECVFPLASPAGPGCDADPIPLAPATVLNEMRAITSTTANLANINNTRIVITVVRYDADMILRLPFFSPAATDGRFRMWTYSIMRQEVEQTAITQKSAGCSAYPIALNLDLIEDNNYDVENTVFVVEQNDETAGRKDGWSFLSWNISHMAVVDITSNSGGTCQGALKFPGNSVACDLGGAACAFTEYQAPFSTADTSMHRGDWVLTNSEAKMSHAWSELTNNSTGHFTTKRALRVIVYDFEDSGPDANPRYVDLDGIGGNDPVWQYKIARFAIVRLQQQGSCNNSSQPWCGTNTNKNMLAFQWIKWDESCGYE